MKKLFLLMIPALAALMSCSDGSSEDPSEDPNRAGKDPEMVIDMLPETRSIVLTQEQRAFVGKNTDFSFNLFRAISQMPEGKKSSIVSPISVTYVLGMLNDGAFGNTAKEITSVVGFGEGKAQAVNDFCKKLIDEAPETDPSVTLEIANIVIGNDYRHVGFEPQYEWDMQDYYRAEITNLDFSQKTETLAEVNGWCYDKTHGMIPEILNESELNANALLLLMNAIYFKATWTEKFDPADTRDKTFTTEGGQTLSLPMMHRKALAQYSENDVCTMLNLPYGSGDKWSMKVLLPREGKTVDDVIASLNAESWQQLRYNGWSPIVDIEIPRFKTTFETDLIEPLSAMGAPTMFMPGVAEFPNISSNFKKDVYVGLMKQKAAIEVDEEGTKASAVTIAEMKETSAGGPWDIEKPMNVDFHANRPFVYVIQEASSGVIFFLGTYRGE